MMSQGRRKQLYAELNDAMRESASRAVLMHQTIADRFGLNSTDLKTLDLARDEQVLTAGRLATLTGMSTSAITAVLDRLERRGLVERRRDPADRRKVVIVATGTHVERAQRIFAGLGAEVERVLDEYDEDRLAAFVSIIRRLNEVSREYTERLSDEAESDAG
ncbi:MarR family transcriptional regulator [Actinocatenispora rupis]|uniref:Putative HTH-type transcriptional regulator YcgE n=2 Tax=Actinocatenispora rupis TaxID=519421 RepID=A0A8J3JBA3_9ACTN|nr:putative HTH-type transcriptional regulator YcgE [Actinocatenispora rupis]